MINKCFLKSCNFPGGVICCRGPRLLKREAELMYKCFLSRFIHPWRLHSIRYLCEAFRVAAWKYFLVETNRWDFCGLSAEMFLCDVCGLFKEEEGRGKWLFLYALFSMHFTCKCNEVPELPCSATLSIWEFDTLLKGTSALPPPSAAFLC